ncbi:MAG: N-acetylglucosamine-6-phosphate deacetylase [Blastocatellales bacterium]
MRVRGKIEASEKTIDLTIAGGRIEEIHTADLSQACDPGGEDFCVSPGLIDIQINGYDGIDFNDTNTNTEQIIAATRQLWRTGVTAFCPTIITGSFDHIAKCISNLVRAADESPEFARAMIGIHVEGPFISPEDGPRGAHPKEHARPPDWNEFQRWQDAARGKIRIVTLSPEWPDAIDFIERAAAAGVIVAIGHTAATPAQIADAVKAGARLSTHLGNGSHAKIDRHPNYIWEQLANDDLWASFIVDGHHLPPSVVKCFLRSKGIARGILVSDAIAAAGKPAGRYKLGNVEVEVTPARRVCLPGTPYLAGSVLEMHEAVAKTVQYSDATLDEALLMASHNPAKLLGVADQFGSIEAGRRADLILFRWDAENSTLDVAATIINGELVYRNESILN